ncbi:VOC family protein [Nocardioides lijunqiniae]|uniref:VOC family protein n=1 Tax=Nocardioides lijunqiniae TaxID=2760832 RepID=UPI0018777478|nr:VOC family protein [Nocardioides lijunqiniae]
MSAATYKDLCIDAVDAPRLARFWAEVLHREVDRDDADLTRLTGPTERHTVWVNRVPEAVTVKQRVHLDVHAASVDDVLSAGAAPLDLETFRWKVLRDPEGGELCVFERDPVPDERLYEIGVDSADPERIATWWADVLGSTVAIDDADGSASVRVPGAPFESFVFSRVPEPKTVKNRIHWDVDTADVGLLVGDGARILREPDDDVSWTVLADPEGNEFCAFVEA